MKSDILIVGVGGQGTLLTSRILGNMALKVDSDVKVSEVHGMAQRGGSVVTHVRIDEKVASPLISIGGADVILAFEELEALRWVDYLKPEGILIINAQKIMPMPVVMGVAQYPDDIAGKLKEKNAQAIFIDAMEIAQKIGNLRVFNSVLMGALAKRMPGTQQDWLDVLLAGVPPRTVDANQEAFLAGYAF